MPVVKRCPLRAFFLGSASRDVKHALDAANIQVRFRKVSPFSGLAILHLVKARFH
jgi:hypothetical protein